MNYPWWHIPYLTAPMLIALVAIVHVLISMYAVGGGLLLAWENSFAIKKKQRQYREYWRHHTGFFLVLSLVFGGVTGVGVWWTIGLASPTATEQLIRIFVFGWAIEWVFFIIEIAALFVFYYCWHRLPDQVHRKVGFIYAAAAWISLVLITGITAFMLNSRGLLTDWLQDSSFWSAFFNRQTFPQILARTGGSLLLASLYVWLHATWTDVPDSLREKVVRRVGNASLLGIAILVLGIAGWFFCLPKNSLLTLQRAAALNVFLVLGAAILAAMVLLIFLGPIRNPRKLNLCGAAALMLFGIAAVGTMEFVREAVRKPFIIDRIVYGNQLRDDQIVSVRRQGILRSGIWTRMYLAQLQEKYPHLQILPVVGTPVVPAQLSDNSINSDSNLNSDNSINGHTGGEALLTQYRQPYQQPGGPQPLPSRTYTPVPTIPGQQPSGRRITINQTAQNYGAIASPAELAAEQDPRPGMEDLLMMEPDDRAETGRVVFMNHCANCHAEKFGYSAVAPLLVGKTTREINMFIRHLNRPGINMPPWCGNDVEAQLLAEYLTGIRPEIPSEGNAAAM